MGVALPAFPVLSVAQGSATEKPHRERWQKLAVQMSLTKAPVSFLLVWSAPTFPSDWADILKRKVS